MFEIPKVPIELEASLVKYAEECVLEGLSHGINRSDFSNYQMKTCFEEVETLGFAKSFPVELLDVPTGSAYVKNTALPKIEEIKARIEDAHAQISNLKDTVDLNRPYGQKGGQRSLLQGLQSAENRMKGSPKGICSDEWRIFEDVMGGFYDGHLIGIVAESGGGKTTLAINWMHNIMMKHHDLPSLIFSLEMDEGAFKKQVAKIASGLSASELTWKVNNDPDFDIKGFDYGGWHNAQFDYETDTLKGIIRAIDRNKPRLVMIDHAQFIEMESNSEGSWIKKLCKDLKQCAKRNGCAIILLSQIDKSSAKTHLNTKGEEVKKKPRLVDALGGISFKSALDFGVVIWRKGPTESIVYYDKVREPYDYRFQYNDFAVDIDGPKGRIYQLTPIMDDK